MTREVIEILCYDAHGRLVGQGRFELTEAQRTFTIGRSLLADVSIPDPHAAPLHTRIEVSPDRQILAEDLGSKNGSWVAKKLLRQGETAPLPDQSLRIGRTRVQLRTSWEPLPPERSSAHVSGLLAEKAIWPAAIGSLGVAANLAYTAWMEAPMDLVGSSVPMIALGIFVIALWIAVWALFTRIMRGNWRVLDHAAVAFALAAGYLLSTDIVALVWYMFTLPGYNVAHEALSAMTMVLFLFLHLRLASNASVRSAAAIAVLLPAIGLGFAYWMSERISSRNVNLMHAEMRIYPPGYRMTAPRSMDDYFAGVARLREAAERRRDALPETDDGGW